MRPALALVLLLSPLGCGSGPTSQADPTPTAPTAPAPPAEAATGAAPTAAPGAAPAAGGAAAVSPGLPDLGKGLETGSCGNGPGNEGADSHFLGEFTVQGGVVSGTERWLLAANDKLQASPLWNAGAACEVRWMMSGTVTAPQHCGDCDLGLQLTANVDMTGSTCPEDMVKREKSFSVRYDVRRAADGVAWVYFGSSGKLLGQGYHQTSGDSTRFNYVTQHQCKWF